MNNIQQQEGNCQNMNNGNMENKQQLQTLTAYLSGFDNPEKACAFLEDILVYNPSGQQWAVGGLIMMLDTIANQKSLEDVKSYVAKLQAHLLGDWATDKMPESVLQLRENAEQIN